MGVGDERGGVVWVWETREEMRRRGEEDKRRRGQEEKRTRGDEDKRR
jgi:hypothetical protein